MPQLAEVFAGSGDAAAWGFALAQLPTGAEVLWVQDRLSGLEMGRPSGAGLKRYGADPARFTLVRTKNAKEALWAMEEGLKCTTLGAVIGEITGNPKALDFTATKRLAMRAERAGVPVILLRIGGQRSLSAARRRWAVEALPSVRHRFDPKAPGAPRWQAELFRGRDMRPGTWEAGYEPKAHRLNLSAPLRHPEVAEAQVRAANTL
ncbi:hypothetical protein CFI11_01395 [Thalassococcus sp. S3]|nr:hypothetical protein CFI11_01395 [Thalassococcus sp. S3]